MSFVFVPKEFDEVELSPPSKPTKIYYKKQGVVVVSLAITYEGATENIEKVEVDSAA
jgi:hypothetical protein